MMRKLLFSAIVLALLTSCKEKKSSKEDIILDSSGNINHVSVVIDNELWKGSIGEAIRNVLAAPIYGLPQDEPMFTINQIPPSVFSGFVAKNRTILKIEYSNQAGITISDNVYAQPQKVIIISGKTKEDIINEINNPRNRAVRMATPTTEVSAVA